MLCTTRRPGPADPGPGAGMRRSTRQTQRRAACARSC